MDLPLANKYFNYLYLRFLAASDFFLRFTLGFSQCSLLRSSVRTPERAVARLKRRSALSRDSPSLTLISAIFLPPSAVTKQNLTKILFLYYTTNNFICQQYMHNFFYFTTIFTILLGTAISFTMVLPSIAALIFSSAFAAAIASSFWQLRGSIIVPFSLPFT